MGPTATHESRFEGERANLVGEQVRLHFAKKYGTGAFQPSTHLMARELKAQLFRGAVPKFLQDGSVDTEAAFEELVHMLNRANLDDDKAKFDLVCGRPQSRGDAAGDGGRRVARRAHPSAA